MKVTQAAIRPSEASQQRGRPALTPEPLPANGARYSRNNEGLDAILSKSAPQNLDKSLGPILPMMGHRDASWLKVAVDARSQAVRVLRVKLLRWGVGKAGLRMGLVEVVQRHR